MIADILAKAASDLRRQLERPLYGRQSVCDDELFRDLHRLVERIDEVRAELGASSKAWVSVSSDPVDLNR